MSRKTRNPNARLQRIEARGAHHTPMPVDKQVQEIRDVLVDMWALISPFSAAQTGDYTVTGNVALERVVMTNTTAATVTLPANPKDLAEVFVKRTDAQVTIDGNGKTIDGQATQILGSQYDGAHMLYTDAAGEWSFV
jgi:hypothetical protein